MTSHDDQRWRAKVAAYLHDPPEKALVLMTGKHHEAGTVSSLCREIFGTDAIPDDVARAVREADRWAAAADRLERPSGGGNSAWDRISFRERPHLVHPLSGQRYDLESLSELQPDHVEAVASDHLKSLVVRDDRGIDFRATFHRLWRLAPDIDAPEIAKLWRVLPADTRVPDHSIWEHLGLASAFAGVFALGAKPALLAVSIGPVQSFIAQARSMSDLWAGSHLLSTLSWEAMAVICERFGPDAILFPALRGVPIVDLWLRQERGVPFNSDTTNWLRRESDANPLFIATLPNRFVALVPEQEAERIGPDIEERVRRWACERAVEAWEKIAEAARVNVRSPHVRSQIEAQLAEFPEVHWAAAGWSLAGRDASQPEPLRAILARFSGGEADFFSSDAWKLWSRQIAVDDAVFWQPNPGVLYPALYELSSRALAAAKATRTFESLPQEGYRCSLCGEREWLAADASARLCPRGEEPHGDPWPRVAAEQPSWARGREHLCALCTLKRLWPPLFTRGLTGVLPDIQAPLQRYVVSTHTMALVPSLEELAASEPAALSDLDRVLDRHDSRRAGWVALPRRMLKVPDVQRRRARSVVAVLDALHDELDASKDENVERKIADLERALSAALGHRPESYYALLLLDGDGMGAWLSSSGGGEERPGRPRFRELWHADVEREVRERYPGLAAYLDARAPASPGYHAALSGALNALSSEVFPEIVEGAFRGKVLYAGGDDLLAMAPVADLLPLMLALRCAYSGTEPDGDEELVWQLVDVEQDARHRIRRGHVLLGGWRLARAMGNRATCSIGAVIAHQMTPLGAVLRDLRAAEGRAKNAGRNAFSITLAKRAGGTTELTCGWGFGERHEQPARTPIGVLLRLQRVLSQARQAAFLIRAWLPGLPPRPPDGDRATYIEMLTASLRYHLERRDGARDIEEPLAELAADLVHVAVHESERQANHRRQSARTPQERARIQPDVTGFLDRLVGHAEFLARAQRSVQGRV